MQNTRTYIHWINVIIVFTLLIFRNHHFIGAFLNFSCWFWITLTTFFIYSKWKTETLSTFLGILLLFSSGMQALKISDSQFGNYKTDCEQCKTEVKVMSYNLFFKNKTPSNCINIIKNENPDILIIQEFTPQWEKCLNDGLNYAYKITHTSNGTHGLAIYSKYPLKFLRTMASFRSNSFAQLAVININGKRTLIANCHLASPAVAVENRSNFFKLYEANYKQRKEQYSELMTFIKKHNYDNYMLAGDLNTPEQEPLYKTILEDWQPGKKLWYSNYNTFPNSSKSPALLKLDYILLRGEIKVKSQKTVKKGSSDHFPIITKIKI